jgi:hypothetical protein
MRALRELEPPSLDEGFADIEEIPFVRAPAARGARGGVFVAAAAADHPFEDDPTLPHLVFDWQPGGTADAIADPVSRLTARVDAPVEATVCPHPGGPPICWCRPPLPGLVLAFASTHGIDPSRSMLVGTSPAHRTLATTLGARYVSVA